MCEVVAIMDISHYYLVDMENVFLPGLNGLNLPGKESAICMFISNNMHTGSSSMKKYIESSEAKFDAIFCNVMTKNAVDFQISAYCGSVLNNAATKRISLISKDKGFQSLADYVNQVRPDVTFYQAYTIFEAYAAAEMGIIPEGCECGKQQDIREIMEETLEKRDPLYRALDSICNHEEITKVQQMMQTMEMRTMRNKYLWMIKEFGKVKGTTIYNAVKEAM